MKKFIALLLISITSLLHSGQPSINIPAESIAIDKLLHDLYKEEIKALVKFKCKDGHDKVYKYYKKFFTAQTALILTKRIDEEREKFNSGAFAEDPRYSDDVRTGDPEDPWMCNAYRSVKNTTFHTPIITGNIAIANVDSVVESKKGQIMRSEFRLKKGPEGWRIENITWGPKGEFEEHSKLGLRSIH